MKIYWVQACLFTCVSAISLTSCTSSLGFGGDHWKEEALLHDGSKIIVNRYQSFGGAHEIGQPPPIKEEGISFVLPNTNETVSFKSEYSSDIERTNFNILALDIFSGIPYLVTEPYLCLSFSKWGRPNPPYVIFKYVDHEWKRIPLSDLPVQFKNFNLTIETQAFERDLTSAPLVTAAKVQDLNRKLFQPQYQTILREPISNGGQGAECGELIHTNDGWEGLGFFKSQKSYEACQNYCIKKEVTPQNCPCTRLFKNH